MSDAAEAMEVGWVQLEQTSHTSVDLVCVRCGQRRTLEQPTLQQIEKRLAHMEASHQNCPEGFWFGQDRRRG